MGANGLAPTNLEDLAPGAGSCIDVGMIQVFIRRLVGCLVAWLCVVVCCLSSLFLEYHSLAFSFQRRHDFC